MTEDARADARERVIESMEQSAEVYGLSRSAGRIYGVLYFAARPRSIPELVEETGYAKSTVSSGRRFGTSSAPKTGYRTTGVESASGSDGSPRPTRTSKRSSNWRRVTPYRSSVRRSSPTSRSVPTGRNTELGRESPIPNRNGSHQYQTGTGVTNTKPERESPMPNRNGCHQQTVCHQ